MASTVNVPIFGPVSKGKFAGVVVGGTAVAGFLIYRKQKTAKKQAAAAAAAQAAASNAYGYGQSGAAYGYGGVYDNGYYGYGSSGGFNPTGYYGYGLPNPPGGTLAPVANTTNAQWAQAAINQLSQDGYDKQTVLAALGAYETGAPVTAAQQSIVQQAIGIEGYPPVSGANGFPPSINVQGTPGGGTGGGQGGGGGGDGGGGGGGGGGGAGPNPAGKKLSEALGSSNIVNVSYAYADVPQSQWSQYGSHTIASATPTGSGWRVGLN